MSKNFQVKKWFTSDLHMGHDNILTLGKGRPQFSTLHEMHVAITKRWNSVVGPVDIVFVLGDFALKCNQTKIKSFLDQLNGRKILVKGNHDRESDTGYMTAGFDMVFYNAQIMIAGRKVNLSHFPYLRNQVEVDEGHRKGYNAHKHDHLRIKDDGNWLLHGHVHTAWKQNGKMINVGTDVWDFTPVSISHIESIIARLEQNGKEVYPRKIEEPVSEDL